MAVAADDVVAAAAGRAHTVKAAPGRLRAVFTAALFAELAAAGAATAGAIGCVQTVKARAGRVSRLGLFALAAAGTVVGTGPRVQRVKAAPGKLSG
jgi:hypothetical protein